MVDTFFERALHQIETPASQSAQPIHAGDSPAHHISPFSYDDEEEDPFSAPEEDLNSGESYDLDAAAPEEDYVSQTLAEVIDLNDFAIAEPSLESPKAEVGYYVFAITLDQYDYDVPEDQIAGNYPLFVYGFNRIRAVLSEVPLDEYGETALQSRLNDPSWFEHTLKKHNSILSKIQSVVSMVPMRICTICDSTESLTAFLNEHHDDFVNTLELIEGNQSWRFSISCNQRKLRLLTEKASNRVRAIHAETSGKSAPEAQRLLLKLEQVLEEEARSVCRACIKHSHGSLSSFASKNLIHSLSGEERRDPSTMNEIFRCEYLVDNQAKEAFLQELYSLKESYKPLGFDLMIEGPFPPSQFTERKVLPAESTGNRRHEKAQSTNARRA